MLAGAKSRFPQQEETEADKDTGEVEEVSAELCREKRGKKSSLFCKDGL